MKWPGKSLGTAVEGIHDFKSVAQVLLDVTLTPPARNL